MLKFLSFFAISVGSALFGQIPGAPPPQQPPQAQANPSATVPLGTLNLNNASLSELVDTLARQLHINVIYDVPIKGGVTLNTYGDPRTLDARDLLDQVLRINGYGIT